MATHSESPGQLGKHSYTVFYVNGINTFYSFLTFHLTVFGDLVSCLILFLFWGGAVKTLFIIFSLYLFFNNTENFPGLLLFCLWVWF